ncbi:MAG: acylphosphatase [Anaerolineaceae bacterium]|nr:acylphosphatase [Anaerolineaceae bacterium]
MKNKRFHVIIKGRVQGVGFRYFTKETAQKLGITGWVRNTFSGDVEVTAEGTDDKINTFMQSIQRGPQSAFVSEFDINWDEPTGEFKKFSILSTY